MTKATLGSCLVAMLAAPVIPAAFAAPQAAGRTCAEGGAQAGR